jgi:hypothetical protein
MFSTGCFLFNAYVAKKTAPNDKEFEWDGYSYNDEETRVLALNLHFYLINRTMLAYLQEQLSYDVEAAWDEAL